MIDKTDSGTEVQKMQMAEIDIDNIILQLLSVRDMPGRQVSTFGIAHPLVVVPRILFNTNTILLNNDVV